MSSIIDKTPPSSRGNSVRSMSFEFQLGRFTYWKPCLLGLPVMIPVCVREVKFRQLKKSDYGVAVTSRVAVNR